jgi:hypothetical protein
MTNPPWAEPAFALDAIPHTCTGDAGILEVQDAGSFSCARGWDGADSSAEMITPPREVLGRKRPGRDVGMTGEVGIFAPRLSTGRS